jgi:hypothetical protein
MMMMIPAAKSAMWTDLRWRGGEALNSFSLVSFQLYELSDEPKRKEFLDDLFAFMQKRGKCRAREKHSTNLIG